MSSYQVGPEAFVTLSAKVRDAEGEVAAGPEVMAFVFGMGQVRSEIERAIEGLTEGARRDFSLGAKRAFGTRDPNRVLTVDRSDFPDDVVEGDAFELENAQGEPVIAHVLGVTDDAVILDTNHPLADQDVTFDLEVLAVRPATTREIEAAEAELAESGAEEGAELEEHGAPQLISVSSLIREARGS